jgi:hypothetical protein
MIGRILARTSVVLSMLLLVAICVQWIRSYSVSDVIVWRTWAHGMGPEALGQSLYGIVRTESWRGLIAVVSDNKTLVEAETAQRFIPRQINITSDGALSYERYDGGYLRSHRLTDNRLGFDGRPITFTTDRVPWYCFEFVFPYWSIALVMGMIAGISAWRRIRAARRRKSQVCVFCGYDLRASRERCPECGEPIPASCSGDATSAHESN